MALDPDILEMTHAQRGQELQRLRDLVRTHRNKKDNARCWLNDKQLYDKTLPEGSKDAGRMTLPLNVLMSNCRKYIHGQKCDSTQKQMQHELKRLCHLLSKDNLTEVQLTEMRQLQTKYPAVDKYVGENQ